MEFSKSYRRFSNNLICPILAKLKGKSKNLITVHLYIIRALEDLDEEIKSLTGKDKKEDA